MVHGELGTVPCEAVSFAGICCAGVGAMRYAHMAVATGSAKAAVATGSEVVSTALRARQFQVEGAATEGDLEKRPELAFDRDFLRWMLSDGAGAMLLGPDRVTRNGVALRFDWIEMISYAHEQPPCMYAGAEKMPDGRLHGWRVSTHDRAPRRWVRSSRTRPTSRWSGTHRARCPSAAALGHEASIRWRPPHYSSDTRDMLHQAQARFI
jgi:3-oxoacyl-[acyl-carrier-protein] synthase-3